MSFTFENQGTNTYLVYEIGTTDEIDTMSLGMLTNNSISGFAAASFTQMDTTKYIKYNVSAKVSVSQLFAGAVNKKRLIGVFSGIIDAMLSAEDYMLDTNNLLLDLDYIFADVTSCETVVVCLPIMNASHKNPELGMFFKNIVFNTQFDQTENCDHVAQILNYLNSNPVLSLSDFKELLEKLEKNVSAKPVQTKATAVEPLKTATPAVQQPIVQQPVSQPASNGTTTVQPKAQTLPKHDNLQFGTNYSPNAGTQRAPAPTASKGKEEKPMSMFYLLQHYSKENAAIYKAQQEAKKAKKTAGANPGPQAAPQKVPVKQQPNAGFAIPGKQESVAPAFAVPNQQAPVQQPVSQPAPQQSAPVQTATPAYQEPVATQSSRPINFGETTVLGGGVGETTVLGAGASPAKADPHLIRTKNNEKIPLNKPVFRIGKERSYVDYFISDNTAISRSHANIVNHNGEFFVVDTNSTNHTYVNGSMIHSNEEIKLSHGAKIRLANEDFEFRLY